MGTELQNLAWARARRDDPDLPGSPWAEGLSGDRRRQAWLAALTATEGELMARIEAARDRLLADDPVNLSPPAKS